MFPGWGTGEFCQPGFSQRIAVNHHQEFALMLSILAFKIFALGYLVGASVHGVDEEAERDRRLARYDEIEDDVAGRFKSWM